MRTRKPVAKPCERNGEDNICRKNPARICRLKTFPTEKGCRGEYRSPMLSENQAQSDLVAFKDSQFLGCQFVEEKLIDERLVRYDSREVTGLAVLFNGIEKIHDLNSSIFNQSNFEVNQHDHETMQADETNQTFLRQTRNFRSTAESYPPVLKDLKPKAEKEYDSRSLAPRFMEINPGIMADLWSSEPSDLKHATLTKCWREGAFEAEDFEVEITAYALMKKYAPDKIIDEIWGGVDSEKFKELKRRVMAITRKRAPDWAKRFDKFMKELKPNQKKVIKAEYFYTEEEKPSQKVLSARISMSEDNYKYHLKQATRVLERIYPEYQKRVRRRKKSSQKEERKANNPLPLYRVSADGEKTLIPPPEKRDKLLSTTKISKIKKWARESTPNRAKNLGKNEYISDARAAKL